MISLVIQGIDDIVIIFLQYLVFITLVTSIWILTWKRDSKYCVCPKASVSFIYNNIKMMAMI
jgi:hypothetical protein